MKNHETDSAPDGARRGAAPPAAMPRDTGSPEASTPIPSLPHADATVAANDESAAPTQADGQSANDGESA